MLPGTWWDVTNDGTSFFAIDGALGQLQRWDSIGGRLVQVDAIPISASSFLRAEPDRVVVTGPWGLTQVRTRPSLAIEDVLPLPLVPTSLLPVGEDWLVTEEKRLDLVRPACRLDP